MSTEPQAETTNGKVKKRKRMLLANLGALVALIVGLLAIWDWFTGSVVCTFRIDRDRITDFKNAIDSNSNADAGIPIEFAIFNGTKAAISNITLDLQVGEATTGENYNTILPNTSTEYRTILFRTSKPKLRDIGITADIRYQVGMTGRVTTTRAVLKFIQSKPYIRPKWWLTLWGM